MSFTVSLPIVSEAPAPATQDTPPIRVALVNMPFALADRPSIQCGLLKASLVRASYPTDVHYLNLELAAELGADQYATIAALRSDQFVGDWLFTTAAFGFRGDEAAYRAACPDVLHTCEQLGVNFEELIRLRNEVMPAMLEKWISDCNWSAYGVVGFTSMFEQNVAALALARRIKDRYPGIQIIFGGANFDGEMGPEYVRAFTWIDYAVSGEGDEVLPLLIARIASGSSGVGLPGVTGRRDGVVIEGGTAPKVTRMDDLPDPDFDEYFSTLFRLGRESVLGLAPPRLLFESARGCWWGEKHHCTFCGLNNNGMTFRAKTAEHVRGELRRLSTRYSIVNFEAVDNIIDMGYMKELCEPLIDERLDYSIFYEVKANLKPAQLRTLARAGVRSIQPGIESLSTHVLSLMRKGTTMLLNIRLLKWAHYYDLQVGWNLLTGFPGETQADYALQERVVPLLFHLPPPTGCGPLWLERFSPYYFDENSAVRDVRARLAYSFIYPEDQVDLGKIAYFFDFTMEGALPFEATERLRKLVAEWQGLWEREPRPLLVYQRAPDWLQIIDRRQLDDARVHAFSGAEALAYEFCGESAQTPARVATHLRERHRIPYSEDEIEGMLRRFCELGLAVEENQHFLSLALPVNPNW